MYAVCAPKIWFGKKDIRATEKQTFDGTGSVDCPDGYKAVGGGSWCEDGDMDMAYPDASLAGWKEWHRGRSSGDCRVHAICVKDDHWLGRGVYLTKSHTGYGKGETNCRDATVLSGGSYCTDGEGDWDYPSSDLSGWEQWHRGRSSNDCKVMAVCLRNSVYALNEIGAPCGRGRIRDCSGKCVNTATAFRKKNNSRCDKQGTGTGYDLFCEHFDWDSGECN